MKIKLVKADVKDTRTFLMNIFPNKDEEILSKMIDELKRLGIDSATDLKYLDEEALKGLQSFNSIELKKFTDYLENFGCYSHYDLKIKK